MRLRQGDMVVVVSGNDRGKVGEVRAVSRVTDRVLVEGVNLRWKHKKPSQQNPKGERAQIECSIHASNVMHWDPKQKKGVRKRPA